MATQSLGFFQALGAKMNYDTQRQKILAQNIANANTPDYKPNDLEKVNFAAVLKNLTGDSAAQLTPTTTSAMHLPATNLPETAKSQQVKKTYDVTPTGNAVVMEEQMVNSTENMADYSLMTSLYQKNINMLRIALGVSR